MGVIIMLISWDICKVIMYYREVITKQVCNKSYGI